MPDTRFSIDLDEVATTVRRLAEVERHLGAAAGQASWRLAGMDDGSAGDLTGALHAFADHWEHGVQSLHRTVGDLHEALGTAHRGYAEHDAALARQLSGGRP